MTESKMIVIWGNADILSSSIEFFLAAKEDWQVVSITSTSNLDALLLALETTQPDILIINQECLNYRIQLPLNFLQDHPGLKVITFNLENNAMEVYSKQKIMVKQASDLIAVIENNS